MEAAPAASTVSGFMFTPAQARRLTDEIKADAARLWTKLLQLYEHGAHTALGFASWGAFYAAEFGESNTRGEQILRAARVVTTIENTNGIPPQSERVARELAPLLREPEKMAEAWQAAIDEHGPKPTAEQVRAKVRERLPFTNRPRPKQKTDEGAPLWEDESVLAWVAKRLKARSNRDKLMAESKAGAHGWPLPGRRLGQNAADRAIAVVKDRERATSKPEPKRAKRKANWNGKTNPTRTREAQAERKGNYNELLDLVIQMNRASGVIESYKPEEFELELATADLINTFHDDLVSLHLWCDVAISATLGWLREGKVRGTIAALRNVKGREGPEAESYLAAANALADKLERKLGRPLPRDKPEGSE